MESSEVRPENEKFVKSFCMKNLDKVYTASSTWKQPLSKIGTLSAVFTEKLDFKDLVTNPALKITFHGLHGSCRDCRLEILRSYNDFIMSERIVNFIRYSRVNMGLQIQSIVIYKLKFSY